MRVLFLIFSLVVLTCPALAADAPRKKPNVLFIISDDLKPLLGCYGTSWIKSPNIDRLALRGTVFKANYCQVAFCALTRFSLLTGLRPDSTGMYLNPDQPQDLLRKRLPEVVTLPQQFKNHGYTTHPLDKVFDGRAVKRLLDDPRHGERWARHWMDIWRYSDWWGLGEQGPHGKTGASLKIHENEACQPTMEGQNNPQ